MNAAVNLEDLGMLENFPIQHPGYASGLILFVVIFFLFCFVEEKIKNMIRSRRAKLEYVCLNCHQSLDDCECEYQEPECIN